MTDRLARTLVELSMELYRRRLWSKAPADAPFLVRVPDEEFPLVVILIGQQRSSYGATILRGEQAFAALLPILSGDQEEHSLLESGDYLGVSFEPMAMIPAELRPPLVEAGFSARRENMAPYLMVKKLGRRPRAPNRSEMRTMAWCLRGILSADDAGQLRPQAPDWKRQRVLEIAASGDLGKPVVEARMVPWPERGLLLPGLLALDEGLSELPRIEESWIASLASVPGSIRGEDRDLKAAVLVDCASELILGTDIVLAGDLSPIAALLTKVMRERAGRPHAIAFTTATLHAAMAPALSALDVRTSIEETPAFLAEVLGSLHQIMGGPGVEAGKPETLADWKEVDRRVSERLTQEAMNQGLVSERTLARYFGSKEVAQEVLNEMMQLGPMAAFLEWLFTDHRPTRRSKTLVEKQLEKKRLDPAERVILEARRDATLSVYRVDACQPGATLDVEDILSGEQHVVHDRAMSGCSLEGYFLPLRLMHIGEWTFPCFGGPPMASFHVDRALAHLEGLGVALSRDGLRKGGELVGRLWRWMQEAQRTPPKLTNTDGDPLELRTATFAVADPGALTEALLRREDVEQDEPGAWTWARHGSPAAGLGQSTVLGRLSLHDQELVLEINSARRLERARKWLERIPGVAFLRERVHDLDADELPLDDQLPEPAPEPLSTKMLAEVTRQFHAVCRAWLDEKVPALGNKTPRAACKTGAGRERVARLVRAMAPMQVPGGEIPVPRKELLRELGIEA